MATLSRRPFFWQFKHFSQITLHTNIQFLSTQQHANQSFWLLPGFIPFASLWVNLEKNIYINMNYSHLTTMYESIFAQMHL